MESLSDAAQSADDSRLLTGLNGYVAPEGVTLCWTVDESRADAITRFSCVFRSPGHNRTGVTGSATCPSSPAGADARSITLTDLPEYGDYDFEVVALIDAAGAIAWSQRAQRISLTVAEELVGPQGPGRAVGFSGPLVEFCGPGGLLDAGDRPWRLDQIVSAAHLTHYPGRGWSAGGDPAAAPEWPEPLSLVEMFEQAGVDAGVVGQVLSGDAAPDGSTAQQAAALMASERVGGVVARAGAGTKALVRPSPDVGHELRLHTSYPFGGVYVYEAEHAVAGWNDPASAAVWPSLAHRTDCPPPAGPHATHDVALALAEDAGDGYRLEHSGYGWWAVAPVGIMPERIVAAVGGLSHGDAAPAPPEASTRWAGRVSGHLFWDRQRWALAGDLSLMLDRGALRLSGRIDNVVLQPLDLDTLAPQPAPAIPWRSLIIDPAALADGAWSASLSVGPPADVEPAAMPPSDAFEGDWRAEAYGPNAGEIAGRLRLYTPLPPDADPAAEWPAQSVLVAGFGGKIQ